MIRIPCDPGGPEWKMSRLGIPTASQFHKIITPKTMKLSSQADAYMHHLLAEQILGEPVEDEAAGFYMERGNILEKKARQYYELERDCDTEVAGFLLRDDHRVGATPDRLVGDEGLLEIKAPTAANHVGYLLDSEGIGYKAQVQGQLWIAERAWCDTLSYNPQMPPALVRQHRDERFIAALAKAVDQFLDYMEEQKLKLQNLGLFLSTEPKHLRAIA